MRKARKVETWFLLQPILVSFLLKEVLLPTQTNFKQSLTKYGSKAMIFFFLSNDQVRTLVTFRKWVEFQLILAIETKNVNQMKNIVHSYFLVESDSKLLLRKCRNLFLKTLFLSASLACQVVLQVKQLIQRKNQRALV